MKLIFKTKEQDPDFTRTLIKMVKFHILSTGRYSPSRKQIDEDMPGNF